MRLDISKVVVRMTDSGNDEVYVYTNKPSPHPSRTQNNLIMQFGVSKGDGPGYVRENFLVEPEVLDCRKETR